MKEMEAKTENRYEYRKPQEKRKQMIAPDLFGFAYVPGLVRTFSGTGEIGIAGIMEVPKAEPGNKECRHPHFRTLHTYNFSQTDY